MGLPSFKFSEKIRMSNKFANIDPAKPASYRQYDLVVYKLTQPLAKKKKIAEKTKEGKINPKFRILKARVGASLTKFYGDKNAVLTHGDVQTFLANPVIPKGVMELIDTKIAK